MQAQRRPSSGITTPRAPKAPTAETTLRETLKEVQSLLESYAPTWYTEALSKKILTALKH